MVFNVPNVDTKNSARVRNNSTGNAVDAGTSKALQQIPSSMELDLASKRLSILLISPLLIKKVFPQQNYPESLVYDKKHVGCSDVKF